MHFIRGFKKTPNPICSVQNQTTAKEAVSFPRPGRATEGKDRTTTSL